MTRILLVAAGGAIGSVARYGLGVAAGRWAPNAGWPAGTFAANVAGGLLMGLLVGWLAFRGGAQQEAVRLFAAVGVLGGFTTFSSFSLDVVTLVERGAVATAALYVFVSVAGAIGALFAGLMLARGLFGSAVA